MKKFSEFYGVGAGVGSFFFGVGVGIGVKNVASAEHYQRYNGCALHSYTSVILYFSPTQIDRKKKVHNSTRKRARFYSIKAFFTHPNVKFFVTCPSE